MQEWNYLWDLNGCCWPPLIAIRILVYIFDFLCVENFFVLMSCKHYRLRFGFYSRYFYTNTVLLPLLFFYSAILYCLCLLLCCCSLLQVSPKKWPSMVNAGHGGYALANLVQGRWRGIGQWCNVGQRNGLGQSILGQQWGQRLTWRWRGRDDVVVDVAA